MRRVLVCIGTYNERNNIVPMVHALGDVLTFPEDRVLVIDDASPDGTGELADDLASRLPWLEVLHRPRKEGLGSAYVAGFRRGIELGVRFVVTMDCDFSHDPRDVPRLVEAADHADIVVGSRYVTGGRNECGPQRRRILSRGGCDYARAILGVDVSDLTGGFKCYRRTALETIDVDRLRVRGYAANIEVTFLAICAGLRVREIPIHFTERRADESKMAWPIVVEAVWSVPAVRLRAFRTSRRGHRVAPWLVRDEEQRAVHGADEHALPPGWIDGPDDRELGKSVGQEHEQAPARARTVGHELDLAQLLLDVDPLQARREEANRAVAEEPHRRA